MDLPARISIPDAELDDLSFAEATPAALEAWVGGLPMANTAEAATQIRQATFEIARLKTDYLSRMALLESIRPTLHYLCARLDRAALTNQQGETIARLAQRLQTNLCSGYKAVIAAIEALPGRQQDPDTLALALHRTLADLARTLLRTLQFYVAPADRLWLDLNQLYWCAEQAGLATRSFEDPENHSRPVTTVTDAYLRSVLIATCKPNQLRHRQLSLVFNALELWTPNVDIEALDERAVFAVDLQAEQGPRYRSLLDDAVESRGIRTDVLVYELEAYLKDLDGSLIMPDAFDRDLVSHLADAWGVMRQRAFRRSPANGSVKVCIGMRAAHYFLSGGVEFFDQLDRNDALVKREVNPFLAESHFVPLENPGERKDVWDDAFDLRIRIPQNPNLQVTEASLLQGYRREREPTQIGRRREPATPAEDAPAFKFYDTTALDTSPGGYCIRWNEPLPGNVQTGEFMAMRDSNDPRWCVAVVRWIRQDGDGTTMGIELLAPRAIPVAARVIQKRGGPSDYTRAFLLPELSPINQPSTLITPLVPFNSGQKIHLQRQGVQSTAQLQRSVLRTESFNQFTFRMLDGYLENARVNLSMGNLAEMVDDSPERSK